MSIPSGFFNNTGGTALMRYNHAVGDWTFVSWVDHGSSVIEQLSAGTYTYQIWLVCGYFGGGVSNYTIVAATAKIAVIGNKK